MDSTRITRYDAYKAVRGLVEELRNVKLFDGEADSVLWAAEGLCSQPPRPTRKRSRARRNHVDTLMQGLAATRWQDVGPTTAESQRTRLVEVFAECAPPQTVAASASA